MRVEHLFDAKPVGSASIPARKVKASCDSGARLDSRQECVRQPFARHVVAGEDARACLAIPPFTRNARSSHTPVANR